MAIPKNLLQAVEEFYRRAMRHDILKKLSAPIADFYDDAPPPVITQRDEDEDVGEYDELMRVAQQVSDPGLSSELQLIAEMYKKAIEIGGGYNAINKAISNMINIYLDNEDDPEQEMVETALDNAVKDLRSRAGGPGALSKPDSPEALAQLVRLKNDYNKQNLEEEIDDLSKYDERAVSTYDPYAGMGKEEAGKGSGRGVSNRTIKTPKDWVNTFRQEKERYSKRIENAPNERINDSLNALIGVLNNLAADTIKEMMLSDKLSDAPDDVDVQNELTSLREEIKTLKSDRRTLKWKVRKHDLESHAKELEVDAKTATGKEKDILEEQIKLYKLLSSRAIGRKTERNWRLTLIKAMAHVSDTPMGKATIDNIKKEIEKAQKDITKSFELYQKEDAAKVKALKEGKTLPGLVIHLQQKIATLKKDTALTAKNQAKKDPRLNPIKEAVRMAAERVKADPSPENQAALKAAEKAELEALTNYLNNDVKVKKVIADNVVLYAYRDKLRDLGEDPEGLVQALNEGAGLYQQYANLYKGIGTTLKEIVELLKSMVG